MIYDNTDFLEKGCCGEEGFDFEVQMDEYTIIIGHGGDYLGDKLTLTGVVHWDVEAQDWVDVELAQLLDTLPGKGV